MKRLIPFFLLVLILFCFCSCKIGEDGKREEVPEEAKEIASQIEELNTKKDSSVIENLSDEQKAYFDSIGETVAGTKLVAYSDSVNYTIVYECNFKDNVVSGVTVYHLVKNDSYFNALKSGINAKSEATVDNKNKIIKADKTNDYKSKTYEEMLKELSQYTVVE